MGMLRRRGDDEERRVAAREGVDEESERSGPGSGLVRSLVTLIGLAGAGLLIWLASTFDLGSTSGFWVAMGLVAAAGLALGASQLLGGWTKWGWPRFSPFVFLFAFLPTLVLAGGILLAMRPAGGETDQVRGWAQDLGLSGLVQDFSEFAPVLAFAIGLVLAFCFDTSGPRTRIVSRETAVADEDVHDYRRETTGATTTGSDRTVAEELRERPDRSETVSTGARDEQVGGRDERVTTDRRESV